MRFVAAGGFAAGVALASAASAGAQPPAVVAGSAQASTSSVDRVRVGADTLLDRPLGRKKDASATPIPMLSERLDGCLWEQPKPADQFGCVAKATRSAARAYRRLAGVRQWETDLFSAGSASGLTVVAIGVGHAAKDSLNAWTAIGVAPLISDDLASPGPRARLYNIAAIAMTLTVARAESLNAALDVTAPMVGDPGQPRSLQQRAQKTCSAKALDSLDKAAGKLNAADKKAADKLNLAINTRCDQVVAAANKLRQAAGVWTFGGDQASRNLAADTVIIDDTVARLDRSLRATSRETLSVVLKAPFNLASTLVGGQATPAEYTGRNLPVFTSTYSFNLGRAPEAEVPSPLGTSLEGSDALPTAWRDQVRDLNTLADDINYAISAATVFKSENERSVLSISPGNNPPVTLSAPSRL